jgi:nucleotide-binding universal stress UspA family protein
MSYRDVLVALTAYPEPTPTAAIDDAVAFAAAVGAKISAVACEIKLQVPGSVLGTSLMNVPAMAAAEGRKSADNAEAMLAAFQQAADKQGVFQDRIHDRCAIAGVGGVLVEYARLRDLTIVPIVDTEPVGQDYAQAIIFGSGRPVLVTPAARRKPGAFKLDTAVVAWDFSRPAARAVGDALPLLEKAKQVHVVTVANEKAIRTDRSGAELAKHLARHGVNVALETVDAGPHGIGDVLETYVTSHNADLLVMGAFGHSRFRDFILGGATQSMLARPLVPTLLSH